MGLLLCALCLLPSTAAAADPAGGEPLAPSLQELAKPNVRALPPAAQARRLGVAASGPGSLIRQEGRVLVEARFESGAIARLPALRDVGAEVVASSRRYQQVALRVPFGDLEELSEVPGVAAVTPVREPVLRSPGPCQGGSVISEGVTQLNVEGAREAFGFEGAGQTVGVLSDSFDQALEAAGGGRPIATRLPEDVAANELPGEASSCVGEKSPVRELRPYSPVQANEPPTDEGRAMLQIVHDVAPRAKLAFNSAFNGELAFAEGIERLAAPAPEGAEADVIVDDVSYFGEPFFQDGPVAASVDKVVAGGVTYLTAAGNDNLFDAEGNSIASWETHAFRDSGECPIKIRQEGDPNAHHCLDFNPGASVDPTFGITVEPGRTLTVDLQWAEPWYGVGTDLDAYLLNANESKLLTSAREDNLTTQRPVEILQWENKSTSEAEVQLVINRVSGGTPPVKFILLENGRGVSKIEYSHSSGGDIVGPAVYGHAGAAAAIALGAVNYKSGTLEPYSSRGPVTHYFGPVKGTAPAARLATVAVIPKPDVAATDCGRTTFFSEEPQPTKEPGVWRFCGTSAAAPHAAGVAALMMQAGAECSAQVASGLERTALPVPGVLGNAAGAGLIEAKGALEAALATPRPKCPVTPVEYEVEDPETEKRETPPAPETPVPPAPEKAKAPPSTVIRSHPRKVVRTRRAAARVVFRFASTPAGASFRCQVDGSRWRGCTAVFSRWFGLGRHVLRVQARSGGVLDPTPAAYRFKVVRSR
ncbi:MAG: S8 family serine peptidase [Actinobacteria bacterium]|nr:S8 family serine peptidase [Actinomycetota bacterium]